jgi:uncharacterized repeat protein (TIGR01451 family)
MRGGDSRDEVLTLTPRQPGPLNVRVTASSTGLKQQALHTFIAQKPNLSLRVDGPTKRYVGRPAEWKISVKNEGDADVTGVVVRDRLPIEQVFKFAPNGNYQNGEVVWNVGTLKPGQEAILDLTTDCQKAAVASEKTTTLTADGNVRADKISRLEIQGIAALKMEMTDLNDPVEVGKNVTYRLIITNTGSAPAGNISVKGTAPDLLKPVQGKGPTRETIAGRSIAFDKVDSLQPGAQITFYFVCEAVKEGDVRFRVEYTSDLNQTPLFEEEPTRVIAPIAPGGPIQKPNPVPPPPAGGAATPLPPG